VRARARSECASGAARAWRECAREKKSEQSIVAGADAENSIMRTRARVRAPPQRRLCWCSGLPLWNADLKICQLDMPPCAVASRAAVDAARVPIGCCSVDMTDACGHARVLRAMRCVCVVAASDGSCGGAGAGEQWQRARLRARTILEETRVLTHTLSRQKLRHALDALRRDSGSVTRDAHDGQRARRCLPQPSECTRTTCHVASDAQARRRVHARAAACARQRRPNTRAHATLAPPFAHDAPQATGDTRAHVAVRCALARR
jgi:hypothetical protein